MIELRLLESVAEVPPEVFAEFHGPENYPFLRREWLNALEETGAVSTRTGWIPRHLALYWGTELIAFAPNYIKLHSLGEFVFDQGWAEYSEHQLGVAYYPKSVVCVPFTPATGPRLLFRKGLGAKERETCWDVLTGALPEVAKKLQLSSVHWLFPEEQQGEELEERDWLVRWGVQYQYHRGAAQSFDDYLGSFRSKKRSCIRRERRAMEEQRVQIQRLEGEELGQVSPQLAYALYLSTIDKYFYGRRYLPESFFEKVFQTMPDGLQFVVARDEESSEVIAGALNLLGKEALFGRYWGALKEKPFLHFNICLYQGIETCVQKSLARFEPGAGGEHKASRGFLPTRTSSYHYLAEPRFMQAVADFLEREREAVQSQLEE